MMKKKGFSIAELSVAMGLLVLILTFVVGLFGAATGLPAQHERGLSASQAAAAVLRVHQNKAPAFGLPATTSVSGTYDAEFQYQLDSSPSSHDPTYLSNLDVTVTSNRDPRLKRSAHGLKMMHVGPDGGALWAAHACDSCHTGPGAIGTGSGGRVLTSANLVADRTARDLLTVDMDGNPLTPTASVKGFIVESIMTPRAFAASGYSPPSLSSHGVTTTEAGAIADFLRQQTGAPP
jgi:hypothetical protein